MSSSFWKGALSPYRENQPESSNSLADSHSFKDDTPDGSEYESEMVISTSLSNLNIRNKNHIRAEVPIYKISS